MNFPPEAYVWLAVSIALAVLVDYGVVKTLLDFIRPVTARAFVIGRAGKIAGLIAWFIFFDRLFYPKYLGHGTEGNSLITSLGWGLIGGAVLVAFATLPRAPFGKAQRDV